MTLKGLNRGKFEARLAKTIRWRLEPLGKFKIYQAQSTVSSSRRRTASTWTRRSAACPMCRHREAEPRRRVPEELCRNMRDRRGVSRRDAARHPHLQGRGQARRQDLPDEEPRICRELGAYLLDKHHHLRVDVHNPQLEIMVEIRDYAALSPRPLRSRPRAVCPSARAARALNLLSGGIDSPVAAWCMARRGLALHHIHFASPPYTSLRAKLKVRDLARELVEYTGNCTLFVVPYTKPQEYIRDNAPDVLFTVLMRRSMLRIANQVAKKLELQALITGESLAQVASQTMAALACTDQAQDLPCCAPASAWTRSRSSIFRVRSVHLRRPSSRMRDCCTIFTPPHPKTNPTLDEILAAEAAMPGLAALEAEAAENVEKIYIRMGDDELL